MTPAVDADIVIAGSGPVGVALAHALAPQQALGRSVLQIEEPAPGGSVDRPISLSWGSRLLLDRLRLWPALSATAIQRIHVSQQRHFGRTLISAADHGVEALGYVVSYAELCRLPPAAAVRRAAGRIERWERRDDRILCRMAGADGTAATLSARLLVLADGGRGRQPQGETEEVYKDYAQSAVVCTLRAEALQANTAWELFTPEGPLAVLPYRDRAALVWSSRTASAERLMRLDDAAFLARLQAAFGTRLGAFFEPGPRQSFALSLRYRRSVAEPGVIAVGNAAQSLHPVAGQGLNLGLRDAWELAELLNAADGLAPQSAALAKAYAARRRLDRYAMTRLTDGLIGAFALQWPLAGALRGAALTLLDVVPPARRLLSRRMMFGARGLP